MDTLDYLNIADVQTDLSITVHLRDFAGRLKNDFYDIYHETIVEGSLRMMDSLDLHVVLSDLEDLLDWHTEVLSDLRYKRHILVGEYDWFDSDDTDLLDNLFERVVEVETDNAVMKNTLNILRTAQRYE